MSGMVPLMERLGVTTAAEVDAATLADRLLAETSACDGCVAPLSLRRRAARRTRSATPSTSNGFGKYSNAPPL